MPILMLNSDHARGNVSTMKPIHSSQIGEWHETFDSKLTISIWPFKCQFAAAVGALFKLNAHCGTAFSHSEEKAVHLMEQCCLSLC
jgi:hypothetical protein